MLNILRKSAYVLLSVGALVLGTTAHAGSTIGGNPANGGGTTFGAPSISDTLNNLLNGDGIPVTNPITGETLLLTASTDLEPFPGLGGEASVARLRILVLELAAILGLSENDSAIQTLLRIAETART